MTLQLPAPAKINLYLKITSILENGMHTLDTGFAYVDVADILTFEAANELRVDCSVETLSGPDNLVHRVLAALRSRYAIVEGLKVFIDKRLPAQAGLGGGSSDAATALMAANRLWKINAGIPELIEFATPFGADIPCFLFGEASRAAGVGEKLTPWDASLPDEHLLLAWPGSGLSTAEVFNHFDRSDAGRALTPSGVTDTMRREPAKLGENDLEASACALNGALARLLRHLQKHSNQAWMSGSGSACVALFASRDEAEEVARQLREHGLASWCHIGRLLKRHPADGSENLNWGVAKW